MLQEIDLKQINSIDVCGHFSMPKSSDKMVNIFIRGKLISVSRSRLTSSCARMFVKAWSVRHSRSFKKIFEIDLIMKISTCVLLMVPSLEQNLCQVFFLANLISCSLNKLLPPEPTWTSWRLTI